MTSCFTLFFLRILRFGESAFVLTEGFYLDPGPAASAGQTVEPLGETPSTQADTAFGLQLPNSLS
jgi:hypothetical protein